MTPDLRQWCNTLGEPGEEQKGTCNRPGSRCPRRFTFEVWGLMLTDMLDKSFTKWWLGRVEPFKDVTPEKLAAEREAMEGQNEYNRNYADFLNGAVLPAVDDLVKMLAKAGIVHRVSTWGNQLALRIHLVWRWGELVIMQSHEDAVTFEHHIITEGEKRGDDSAEDHSHQYDLRDALPGTLANQELQFFLGRMAQDLVEPEEEPEIPPGEESGEK